MSDEADARTTPDAGTDATGDAAAGAPTDLRGLVRRGLHPRRLASQVVVGVLCALFGFGLVAQVASTNTESFLRTARTPDLLRLLDDLSARQDALNEESARLEEARDELASGADSGEAALQESRRRAQALGVLTGTTAATGQGVEVRVEDPQMRVDAAVLLDTVQELRDAGAEAIQINNLRVVASTSFLDGENGTVLADGEELDRPFRIKAVGDAATMAAALAIPGGVVDTVTSAGGEAQVERHDELTVGALRELPEYRYARPAPTEPGQ